MKWILLTAFLFCMVLIVMIRSCYSEEEIIMIEGTYKKFQIDLLAISMIESSGGLNLIAQKPGERSYGEWQISMQVLNDYNKTNGKSYNSIDLFDRSVNYKIAKWYFQKELPRLLKHYKRPVTKQSVLQAYNVGAKGYADGKRNQTYLEKYQSYTRCPII